MEDKKTNTSTDVISKPIWKNIGPRAVSGILFSAICIPPVYFGGYVWALLVLAIGLRLVLEWVRMSDPDRGLLAMVIPMIGLTVSIGYIAGGYHAFSFLALAMTAIITALERMKRSSKPLAALWSGLGALYIAVPTVLMIAIRGGEAGFSEGFQAILFVILVVVAADVGAYLGGSALKGPKIAPKLSPNKTWSGFTSGLILGCVVGGVTGSIMGLSLSFSLLFTVPIVVFSVVGDFLESGLKRHFKVKDTGNLMPGHGGLLDRVDGLMLAILASALVLWTAPSLWPGVL